MSIIIFCFKQKTAYEMRISDWSSDVCSSDLALETLDHTRPTIGAQAVGLAQGALDAALAYTKDRKQFGKSISDFQAVQFMLADMAMKVEAARLMVYTSAARAERGEKNLGFISAAAKCFASDVAMEVTTDRSEEHTSELQ